MHEGTPLDGALMTMGGLHLLAIAAAFVFITRSGGGVAPRWFAVAFLWAAAAMMTGAPPWPEVAPRLALAASVWCIWRGVRSAGPVPPMGGRSESRAAKLVVPIALLLAALAGRVPSAAVAVALLVAAAWLVARRDRMSLPGTVTAVGLAGWAAILALSVDRAPTWMGTWVATAAAVAPGWAGIMVLAWTVTGRMAALHRAASVDMLTGIANRRAFEEALARLLADRRWARPGMCATVALIDLDGFKLINDRHGHAAGDAVLVAVGQGLAGAVRANDLVARIGGDEFAILLPDSDRAGAEAALRRLSDVLEMVATGGSVLTATIGATEVVAGDDQPGILSRADRALLAGKADRNGAIRFA